jgi:hypothetical protein
MKPKRTQSANINESSERDRCQTPPYALTPLLPYLPAFKLIWESAAGEGLLATALRDAEHFTHETDILTGHNFFTDIPPDGVEIQVTNPPFSTKYLWLTRSYEMLMPIDVIGSKTAQDLFATHGIEIILMNRRVDFKMPNKGWDGEGAQFSTAWFTHGLNIGAQLTFANLVKPNKQQIAQMAMGYTQHELFEVIAND